jgi:hypothetical protein
LITAAHVAQKAEEGTSQLPSFSNGHAKRYEQIAQPFVKDWNLDVAATPVVLAAEPASDRRACEGAMIADSAGDLDKDLLFVHGFPGDYSKFLKLGSGIFSTTLPLGNITATPTWKSFDPALHLTFGYDPRYQEYEDGTLATLPDPGGLSGSAVWDTRRAAIGPKWHSSDARIVGILHVCNAQARCLVGTRIEHVRRFLAARFGV